MRDPFSWSLKFPFRISGITVKIHILLIVFAVAMLLMAAFGDKMPQGSTLAMALLLGLLFFSILLHEFGHCFAARWVDGDADEILLWPLGGLAYCDVPRTPSSNFITAAGGPAVNLLLCFFAGAVLTICHLQIPWNPLPENGFIFNLHNWADGTLYKNPIFAAASETTVFPFWQLVVAQLFWLNWLLLLLNVLLVAFPLDGGRLLQATLWPRLGYRHSMSVVIFIGFVMMFVVVIFGLVRSEPAWLILAFIIYRGCKHEWVVLETGQEDSLFGYDFSQGYTSLERDDEDEPRPRRKKQSFLQRWMERRQQKKVQEETERTEAEEQRMDDLLQKIHLHGRDSLTEEEKRFLNRVSDRYRNKQ